MITVHITLDEHHTPNECGICKTKFIDNDRLQICNHCGMIYHHTSAKCCSKHRDLHVLRALAGEAGLGMSSKN